MKRLKRKSSYSGAGSTVQFESLEARQMLSKSVGIGVGLWAGHNASETNPTTTGRGWINIIRTGSTAKALKVQYFVMDTSTATMGVDFRTLKGTTTIPKGQTTAAIQIVPIDDNLVEGTETVCLNIRSAGGVPLVRHHTATITIQDNDVAPAIWWDTSWHDRTSISVAAGSYARTDEPVDREINFTSILSGMHKSGSLITDSIRVVETDANHNVIDANVPFQFDPDSDFNASTKASGDLVFLLQGNTNANTTRHYDVYFDTTGSFSPANVSSLINVNQNFTDNAGDDSIEITATNPSNNKNTSYVMEKDNGGLSSILDDDGNDWVSYNNTVGSGGTYRGVPNLGVAGGGHPGFNSGTVTVVNSGPIKTTINVVSSDGKVAFTWEFYPTFARCTVTKADEDNGSGNDNYWFLYEATPGGTFNTSDTAVRSDGTSTTLDTNWDATNSIGNGTNDGEWVYFNHTANNRYIFLVHDTPDNLEDSYYDLDDNMTVFGFGRTGLDHGQTQEMSTVPNSFTIGLDEGGDDFNAASDTINGTYRPMTISGGTAGTSHT